MKQKNYGNCKTQRRCRRGYTMYKSYCYAYVQYNVCAKGRNSIIVAPHPRAKKCSKYLIDLFNDEILKLGAPENLIQLIEEPSIELSLALMQNVDVVIATGGMDMVKSAYSSGKPAYGVGAGNVQCIIDRDIDIETAIGKYNKR